jgi:hypothetical protein
MYKYCTYCTYDWAWLLTQGWPFIVYGKPHRAKQVQYVEPQKDHIFLASLSL